MPDLAFNTDGGGVILKDGRPSVFEVQASEKIYADYQLEVTDVGGHSSLVRPDNPIYTLAAALTRIGEHQFPLHLNDVTRMFLERSASTESGQTAIDMRAVAAVPPDQAAAARLSRSPFYNAQIRTTCVATKVDAGHANNALPQLARAVVNCRILPGLPGAEVEAVVRTARRRRVKVTVIEPPIASPPSSLTPALSGAHRTARWRSTGRRFRSFRRCSRERPTACTREAPASRPTASRRSKRIPTTSARTGKTSASGCSRFTRPHSSGSSS